MGRKISWKKKEASITHKAVVAVILQQQARATWLLLRGIVVVWTSQSPTVNLPQCSRERSLKEPIFFVCEDYQRKAVSITHYFSCNVRLGNSTFHDGMHTLFIKQNTLLLASVS